ncbi:Cytochrome P450 [Penicillium griseofulvum]|uniref:Cytochrome P450 n=1 Tax=Penicillium patulum TaxID=5078 RepID=A0A135LNI6_PENPA|nr:Cytochrome P450 [Penicillium griseofulvum]KXG50521.1 Cytochrome P450 [Penicillium griseofulvum]
MLSTLWLGLIALGFFIVTLRGRKRYPLPLPPGPKQQPIIGNLKDLPSPDQQDWMHWLKHKELYGPISSLTVLGKHVIVLNDAKLAVQLLEKRSAIFSLRPENAFTDMSGWQYVLGALRKTDHVKKTRKHLFQEMGSKNSVARFNDIQVAEVSRFLVRVLDKPENLLQHIRKEAGAIVLKIGYGYTIEPHARDPLVDLADQAMEDFSYALLPATWAVEFIPIMRYLPAWFPGAGFVKIAQSYRSRAKAFSDVPYSFTKQKISDGQFVPSFLSNLLRDNYVEPGTEDEEVLKWSAGSLYAGGADTTVSSIASFFLAMALFPEVQRKAQEEIDTVLGTNRLPQFQDRDNLPYINALVKEVLRWHPVVPMSVPHMSSQDDTCEGYFIPKGSSVLTNVWAYTHDPTVYHDPMIFNPERFLPTPDRKLPERDPHMLVFGFGRRACPGRTLADANVFLTVAQALTVFSISKPIENGVVQDIPLKFLPGVISHPAPFKVTVLPRSEMHERIIRELGEQHPWEKSDAEFIPSV